MAVIRTKNGKISHPAVLDDAVKGFYHFGVNARLEDVSGNGNHGTHVNATFKHTGRKGVALGILASATAYVQLPATADFTIGTGDFTFLMVCQPDPSWTFVRGGSTLGGAGSGCSIGLNVGDSIGKMRTILYNGGTAISTGNIQTGGKVGDHMHYGFTVNRTRAELKMYYAGLPVATADMTAINGADITNDFPIRIGTHDGSNYDTLDLDGLLAAKRCLTEGEIYDLYKRNLP